MKRFRVLWTEVARDDLHRIVDFIAAEAPLNAEKVADRLEALANSLESFPGRGRVVPELARHGLVEWLEVGSPPWRLVYRVQKRTVYVVALVDGRRRLEDLLFERLVQGD